MPADNKKLKLRSLLAGKTTEELEELLALDFAEDKAKPDAEYISIILEVIEERENNTEERNKETLAAWNEFQAYRKEAESHEALEAGKSEKPTPAHRRPYVPAGQDLPHSGLLRLYPDPQDGGCCRSREDQHLYLQ